MLIDSTHKQWFLWTVVLGAAATAGYLLLDRSTPGGLTGGSTVGLYYGLAGAGLMLYAGLLAALRRVPSWSWLGARKTWLRGHIWMGLLSVVLVLCHSGFRWGGPLEQALWIVLALTILTGIYGLFLQQIIPRMLTLRVLSEAPYEQLPHIFQVMRRKGDEIIGAVLAGDLEASQATVLASQIGLQARVQFKDFYDKQVRPFLGEPRHRPPLLSNPMKAQAAFDRLRALPGLAKFKDQVTELETLWEEHRQLTLQQRLHHWLHVWLLIHIPLSVALLVLGVVHVVASLYY